jgi:hypothetical protein
MDFLLIKPAKYWKGQKMQRIKFCWPVFSLVFAACSPAAGDGAVNKDKTTDPVAQINSDSLPLSNSELTSIYALAVSDFLASVKELSGTTYDTLFFGKRKFGQPDDFPDIELPAKIGKTTVRLVTPAEGEKLQQDRKARVYVNLVGWTTKTKADFVFVVFSNGFEHQYDCNLYYTFSKSANRFERTKVQFVGLQTKR